MPRWLVEARQAARSLTRAPGFTALAVLSLGLGLGVTTAVFTVVKQVLLDPLGYPDADRLVVLRSAVPKSGMGTEWGLASAQYFHLGDNSSTLADIGAWDESWQSVAAGDGFYSARMIRATAGIHRLTGARAPPGPHPPGLRRRTGAAARGGALASLLAAALRRRPGCPSAPRCGSTRGSWAGP